MKKILLVAGAALVLSNTVKAEVYSVAGKAAGAESTTTTTTSGGHTTTTTTVKVNCTGNTDVCYSVNTSSEMAPGVYSDIIVNDNSGPIRVSGYLIGISVSGDAHEISVSDKN